MTSRFLSSVLVLCSVCALGFPERTLSAQTGTPVAAGRADSVSLATLRGRVRERESARAPLADRAEAWQALATAFERQGMPDSALALYRRALAAAQAERQTTLVADFSADVGLEQLRANRYDSALVHLQRAYELRLASGDTVGASRVQTSIGSAYYQLGTYEPALLAWTEALRVRRAAKDVGGEARILTNIGKTFHDWRQYPRAASVLREAVTVSRASGHPPTLGYAANSLALLYVDMGEYRLAWEAIRLSESAYAAGQPTVSRADSIGGWSLNAAARGLLLTREGRARDALPILDSVRLAGARRGSVRAEARALTSIGEAHLELGNRGEARMALERALALSRQVAQRVLMLEALEALSLLEEKTGSSQRALDYLRTAKVLRDTIFDQATAQRLAAEESRADRERQQAENARLVAAQREQAEVIEHQQFAVVFAVVVLLLGGALVFQLVRFNRLGRRREEALAKTNNELRTALSEVRTLTGLIPICASCKRVRDDRGYWQAVESYISTHSDATFSHAICQSCGPQLYGDVWYGPDHDEQAAPERRDPDTEAQRKGNGP